MSDYSDQDDEISEIRRVMREAKNRKKMLIEKQRSKWQSTSLEKNEYEDILRKLRSESEESKRKASEFEFSLREARYETNQWTTKYNQLEKEKENQENIYKKQLQDFQLKVESLVRQDDEKFSIISLESDKLSKLFETLVRSPELSHSQTSQHIITKARSYLHKIKEFSTTSEITLQDYRQRVAFANNSKETSLQVRSVDTAVDSAMLDMCRSLEEENSTLHETVQSLKDQLAEAKRESAASQLIPHYRLAIVRSRTYAANLMEQVKREQDTSRALREQLNETYQDLKTVVEEKRKLYTKASKSALQESQLDYIDDEEIPTKSSSNHSSHRHRSREHRHQHRSKEREYDDSENHDYYREHKSRGDRRRSGEETRQSREDVENRRKKKENTLKSEIETLDSTIEKLKGKLSQAALEESQKILNEVLGPNLDV